MAIKINANGDLTWIDDDILYADDLNDTVENKGLRIETQTTDATEYTYTGGAAWQSAKTYTFTPSSSSSILLFIKMDANIKISGGSTGRFSFKIDGTYPSTESTTVSATYESMTTVVAPGFGLNTSTPQDAAGANLSWVRDHNTPNLGAITSFTDSASFSLVVRYQTDDGAAQTIGIKDIQFTVYMLDYGKIATSSAKFS